MSATYTPGAAFDNAKRFVKGMSLDQVGVQILDDVIKYLWMYAPWRWSLGTFPTTALTASTQDYTVAFPSDYLYIQDAYITAADGSPTRRLYIEPWLPAAGVLGMPSRIAAQNPIAGQNGTLRTSPTPGSGIPLWSIVGTYKKQAPNITAANFGSTGALVIDDEWFHVFDAGVLYHAFLWADDQRAGGATVTGQGQVQYTGQRGVFEALLINMKEKEKIPGVSTVLPEQKAD